MIATVVARPVNSIVFVEDRAGGKLPEWSDEKLILATDSCIMIRCYPEQDGTTEITIGESTEIDPGYEPAFEGLLRTPSGIISVITVDENTILEMPIASERAHVRIWTNDPRWPDKVMIGID